GSTPNSRPETSSASFNASATPSPSNPPHNRSPLHDTTRVAKPRPPKHHFRARCSSISASNAASRNRFVSCCNTPPRPSSCTPWARACTARRDTNAGSTAAAIASAVAACSSTGPACTGTTGSSTTAPAVLLFPVVTALIPMSSLSELHRFQDSPLAHPFDTGQATVTDGHYPW